MNCYKALISQAKSSDEVEFINKIFSMAKEISKQKLLREKLGTGE